ncbi:MAG: DNA mismatch endonuclease Vsr [Porphyrobacter sp.]|nr:DNA mismatch endonuclease Vsr [Porphyrobacter sp.]
MVDVVDKLTRSRMMRGIRSKHTSPEVKLRRALHALGYRYRLHQKSLPGSPDLVLRKWNAVVEVHGCFWHRHQECRLAATPEDPTGSWAEKFTSNVARDKRNQAALLSLGWRVAIVWECAIRSQGEVVVANLVGEWLRDGEKCAHFR